MWPEDPVILLQGRAGDPPHLPPHPRGCGRGSSLAEKPATEEWFKTTMMVHMGLIMMTFILILIVTTICFTCWWKRTAIKRALLNNHHTQHKVDQATTPYPWMTEVVGNLLKTEWKLSAPVPWNREKVKHKLCRATYMADNAEVHFTGMGKANMATSSSTRDNLTCF
jgi:hypothetical protein